MMYLFKGVPHGYDIYATCIQYTESNTGCNTGLGRKPVTKQAGLKRYYQVNK